MTLDEADMIIAELNVVFPNKKLLVEEVRRWEGNLVNHDYEVAKIAIGKIEETMSKWPTWAEFLQEIKIAKRDRDIDKPKPELTEAPPLSREENLKKIQEIISLLNKRTTV